MNKEPYLAILSAGMGSRYGSLKQIDKVDEQGHVLIDYSIYDAIEAGFKNIVFIIKKSIEDSFKEVIGNRISKIANVKYVYQEIDTLPQGYKIDPERQKPWGTAHCIMQLKGAVDAPFGIINADDYYGKEGFKTLYNYLKNESKPNESCLVGFRLYNTVSKYGAVTRGVCEVENNMLKHIEEVHKIMLDDNNQTIRLNVNEEWVQLDRESIVSMNMWGFPVEIIDMVINNFKKFLDDELEKNPLKCEYLIPTVVQDLLEEDKMGVKVYHSSDKWFGITYKEDKEGVVKALKELRDKGYYNNF